MDELEEKIKELHAKYGDKLFEWLKRMADKEIENEKKHEGKWIDWEWHEVKVKPQVLNQLFLAGIIEITYKSRSHTLYKLVNRDAVLAIINKIEEYKQTQSTEPEQFEKSDVEIPADLFDIISGFDDIKFVFQKSLESDEPVHILLIGPPACAKTLFLLELSRIQGAFYVLGGSTTKAGLTDALFTLQPRILLIDEIDKMNAEDLTTLLSLMETGIVKETKYGKTREIRLRTWVFAAGNRADSIPPEIMSRFMVFHIPPYDDETLRKVIIDVLTKRSKKDEKLAKLIADSVINELQSRDVRDALKLSKLCKDKECLDRVVSIWKKYRGW